MTASPPRLTPEIKRYCQAIIDLAGDSTEIPDFRLAAAWEDAFKRKPKDGEHKTEFHRKPVQRWLAILRERAKAKAEHETAKIAEEAAKEIPPISGQGLGAPLPFEAETEDGSIPSFFHPPVVSNQPGIHVHLSPQPNEEGAPEKYSEDWVLKLLETNIARAMQLVPVLDRKGFPTGEYVYDGAVANKALELVAKLKGHLIERKQIDIRDLTDLSETELQRRLNEVRRKLAAERGEVIDITPKHEMAQSLAKLGVK